MYQFFALLFLLISCPLIAAESLELTHQDQSVNITPFEPAPFVSCITTVPDITIMANLASHLNIGEIAKLARTCKTFHSQIMLRGKIKPLLLENTLQSMLNRLLIEARYSDVKGVNAYFKKIDFFKDMAIHCVLTSNIKAFIENLEGYFNLSPGSIIRDSSSNLTLTVKPFYLKSMISDLNKWEANNFTKPIYDLLSCSIPYKFAEEFRLPKLDMSPLFQFRTATWTTGINWFHVSSPEIPVNCLDAARRLTQLNVPYKGVAPLYKPLLHLKTLHLLPSPSDSWLLETLPQYLCNVQEITIWNIENLEFLKKHWDYLTQLPSLRDLTLKAKGATPLTLPTDNIPKNLRSLTLTHFKIESLDVTPLTSLKELTVAYCGPDAFKKIKISTTLTSLKYILPPGDNPISFHETISKHLTKTRYLQGGTVVELYHG